jgi:hypothetical protein
MTQYKVYRIFSDLSSYFMVSKVKMNMCLNLLVCYYNKYVEDKKEYKPYFKIFDETEDDYDIEEMGSYDNRAQAKEALLKFINESTNCINITIKDSTGENKQKNTGGKLTKTSDIKLYNKNKYIENKNNFKKYYEDNKDKIREYQKQRYQETKQKLKELEELKKETIN